MTEPTGPCLASEVKIDTSNYIMAPPGSLLTGLRFAETGAASPSECTTTATYSDNLGGTDTCYISTSNLILEGTFSAPTISASSVTWTNAAVPPSSGISISQGWLSNSTINPSGASVSSCGFDSYGGGGVVGGGYSQAPQYIDLEPVALPEGVYAVGAALVQWECESGGGDVPLANTYFGTPGEGGYDGGAVAFVLGIQVSFLL